MNINLNKQIRIVTFILFMVGLSFVTNAQAQVHGCTFEGAEDRTGEAMVTLNWDFGHDRCVIVSPGTTVVWDAQGGFGLHPLSGGEAPSSPDAGSPITSHVNGSVVFNDEGTFPYYCLNHLENMTGVIYVAASPPQDFNKTSPLDDAINQSTSPLLSWQSSTDATSYEHCVDQILNSSCDDVWTDVGAALSDNLAGLANNSTYEWQVRALNNAGNTEANLGVWWEFTTIVAEPGAFGKASPSDAATEQSTSPSLNWASSSGAVSYEYCIDTSDNNTCNDVWTSVGGTTSANLGGLLDDTIYFWQVRAINAGGTTEANSGDWWNFRTIPDAPAAFSKTSPVDTALDESPSPNLVWAVSSGATEYEYCIDTNDNDACDESWISAGNNTNAMIEDLSLLTPYFWQVRASNVSGVVEANADVWWEFTTAATREDIFDHSFETGDE